MISCSPTPHTALLLVIPSCSTAQHALAVSSGSWKLALINGREAAPQQALTNGKQADTFEVCCSTSHKCNKSGKLNRGRIYLSSFLYSPSHLWDTMLSTYTNRAIFLISDLHLGLSGRRHYAWPRLQSTISKCWRFRQQRSAEHASESDFFGAGVIANHDSCLILTQQYCVTETLLTTKVNLSNRQWMSMWRCFSSSRWELAFSTSGCSLKSVWSRGSVLSL